MMGGLCITARGKLVYSYALLTYHFIWHRHWLEMQVKDFGTVKLSDLESLAGEMGNVKANSREYDT